jgi:hypothetical protein
MWIAKRPWDNAGRRVAITARDASQAGEQRHHPALLLFREDPSVAKAQVAGRFCPLGFVAPGPLVLS